MADCELLAGCIFFNDKMEKKTVLVKSLKEMYCLGDNSKCARFMVFKALGRPAVPPDLFPNEIERAQKIIEQNK